MSKQALFTLLPGYYEPSKIKDSSVFLKRIEQEFGINVKKFKWLKWPFDFDVLIINDQLIFRFAKTDDAVNRLNNEMNFLNTYQSQFNLPVPNYKYFSKDGDFAGYELIPGTNLTTSGFKNLSKFDQEEVVKKLINFVNVFHSIETKDLKKFSPHTKSEYVDIEKQVEKDMEKKLFPKLSKVDVDLIKNFYKQSKNYLINAPDNCSLHGDLYCWNVLYDKKEKRVGVIDFTDLLIGDPARDFEVFYDYGEEAAQLAYSLYTGKKDPDFLKRAKIYYQGHGIYSLFSTLNGALMDFDYAYKNHFKRKFS